MFTQKKVGSYTESTKILFLDIDEVLQCLRTTYATGGVGRLSLKDKHLDPISIGLVRKVCKDHDVKIVISSTWRQGAKLEEFSFFDLPIIDMTPVLYHKDRIRGDEIAMWLEAHPEVKKYAILDDSSDFREDQLPFHVHVKMYNGVSYENYRDMVKIFSESNEDFI